MDKPRAAPRSHHIVRKRRTREDSVSSESQDSQGEETTDIPTKQRPHSSNPKSSIPKAPLEGRRDRQRSGQREGRFPESSGRDSADLRRQIDRLERDLERRDRELEEERVENERCMDTIKKLERDKVELKRDVEGFRDEAEDYKRTLDEYKERSRSKGLGVTDESDDVDGEESDQNQRRNGYEITLQQKNKQIQLLIEDTEKLDEERRSLEEKMTALRDSLEEATKQIESMAGDHFNLKSKLQKADERIKQLEEDKTVLSIRERELLGFKERHEQYLENLCSAVDIRVDVWKKMMFDKDEEIDRLESKISTLMGQIPNTQMDSERSTIQLLNKKLKEREHQISLLNEQLGQATEEILSNTKLIQKLQAKLHLTEDSKKTEKLVKSSQQTIKKLEEKLHTQSKQLNSVEKEAEDKSKTLTSLMARMASYESGEYGLPEAVTEIKDLKIQIRIRDKQVEGVTQEINVLQMQVSDLQEENEMLRDKLGLESETDINRETRRYTRSVKNELTALRAKVRQLEEDVVNLKTTNYSLKKQLSQYDLSQQQLAPNSHISTNPTQSISNFPERERDGPDGGSVYSPKPGSGSDVVNHGDMFLKGMTGLGFKREEWKEKYEIILEENTALRRGLHEILDCMHKMTDEGNTEVMIQAPVLEELLREMSSRGIINYPYPISSFHMKVCNLEGKCSQLREELHRIRQEERQCRQELFEAQGTIKNLSDQLNSHPSHPTESSLPPHFRQPHRSGSQSPSRQSKDKRVAFEGRQVSNSDLNSGEEARRLYDPDERRSSLTSLSPIPPMGSIGRNLVLEDLQQEIEFLRSQNESMKERFTVEKTQALSELQAIVYQANELMKQKESDQKVQLKIEFLQAIKDNQANEINSLMRKISELENENFGRVGFLERFKIKALHQIQAFQQILETSVPIHLLYTAKKEIRILTERLQESLAKEESDTMKAIAFHKNAEEIVQLRTERDKFEEELSKCQARLIETATKLEGPLHSRSQPPSPHRTGSIITLESQNTDLTQKLNHTIQMNTLLKNQIEEMEVSKKQLESGLEDLSEKCRSSLKSEQEAQEKNLNSVAREEYDLLVNKLVTTEESLVLVKDDLLKWKEIAEMTQNQIKALENIMDFDKMELNNLTKQVSTSQSESNEKALLAKAHRHMLSADKEKHLAIQQVQKLLSKLTQLEAHSLQQDKIHQEREMSLISMHTHAIMRYRNLFAALHDSQSPKYHGYYNYGKSSSNSQDIKEAFEMFERTQKKCGELEEHALEERLKVEELEQKCKTLEAAMNSLRDGSGQDVVFESLQKVQEARVEVARWKRKAEQKERDCTGLRESVHRLECKTTELEEDRIKLEHSLELKDSLTSTLMAKSMEQLQLQIPTLAVQTLSSTSMPLMTVSSTRLDSILQPQPHKVQIDDKQSQTEAEGGIASRYSDLSEKDTMNKLYQDNRVLSESLEELKCRIVELEACLRAKDDALNETRFVRGQQERDYQIQIERSPADVDLQDALIVARETITSLQDRLKSKEDNVNQYRRLLADVRTEMTNATERHVQEMRALQMTIHQQQQAFTRMKSTLSQPVKDSLNVEGTIKDQLTRIHELEDEVSQLQHAMSNTAAQLTAARSEAHRWRCHAESRMKDVDSARDQVNMESMEELNSLRQELRDTQRKLDDSQQQLASVKFTSARESMTELVNVLRTELEEKDKQIDAYSKSLHNLKNSATFSDKCSLEERLHSKEAEINELQEEVKQLQKTIAGLNVKISKAKAINYNKGTTQELEELRITHRELMDEKLKVERELGDINRKRDEDEQKKMKTAESVARWEESKRWKKNSEKLESRVKELESENDRFKRTMQNLRITITRLEKEKIMLETKLNSRQNQRSNSASMIERLSDSSQSLSQASQQTQIMAQGEIAKLKIDIQDLQELNEKIEFEGREEAEKLKMEVKLLKERIVTQERQLTAYQIAQKGDVKAIAEIENMATREAQLQKEIRRLEEDNLHLNLQIEQLRLDTPRLRDRVQHLQKLVEVLKAEKSVPGEIANKSGPKSLGELEKTINALKVVIEKLQTENKRLKARPPSGLPLTPSTERLKTSMDALLEDKKLLLDKVQTLEHEMEKMTRRTIESSSTVECIEMRLQDAEKRAKSAEMKLRTFLGEVSKPTPIPGGSLNPGEQDQSPSSSYDALVQKMRSMQEELENKSKLLAAAKQSLRAAEKATAPKPSSSPRPKLTPTEDGAGAQLAIGYSLV